MIFCKVICLKRKKAPFEECLKCAWVAGYRLDPPYSPQKTFRPLMEWVWWGATTKLWITGGPCNPIALIVAW